MKHTCEIATIPPSYVLQRPPLCMYFVKLVCLTYDTQQLSSEGGARLQQEKFELPSTAGRTD